MASGGALTDFGRMSAGRKIAIFVVIGGLFFFLYHRFVFKKVSDELSTEKTALQKAQKDLKDVNAKIEALPEMRTGKAELDRIMAKESHALPEGAETPAFFEMLERKFTDSGVQFVRWSRRPEDNVESFVRLPLEVELTGTFMQLKRFFASLAEKKPSKDDKPADDDQDRIVSIENLTLSQPTIRNREIVLTAKFLAVTFRQEDPKPVAVGAVPANAPNPSAATNATGAPGAPPMPSSALDRVQNKVDNSMKKDEQRVKDGIADPGAKKGAP